MANQPEPLTTILGWVNVNLPTFKGSATKDANDHLRRFLAICKSRGLEREDAYLALFPSTLDGYADQWFASLLPIIFQLGET